MSSPEEKLLNAIFGKGKDVATESDFDRSQRYYKELTGARNTLRSQGILITKLVQALRDVEMETRDGGQMGMREVHELVQLVLRQVPPSGEPPPGME